MSSSHRKSVAYYKNVPPRVDSRWLDGTPKLRKSSTDIPDSSQPGKADESTKTRRLSTRRSSESDLRNVQLKPRINIHSPSSNASESEGEESESSSEQLFETAEGSAVEVIDSSENSENVSVSSSIETVSCHFRTLFNQLEEYIKTSGDKEGFVIRKRMNKMKHTMSTINQMFDDLLDDGDFLEEYLMDQHNNNNA